MLKQQEGLFLLLDSSRAFYDMSLFFFHHSTVLRTDVAVYDYFLVPPDDL